MSGQLSVGAQKLGVAATDCGSIRKLAERLGFDFPVVWRWIRGERIPEYKGRKAALDACGIPMEDWETATPDPAPSIPPGITAADLSSAPSNGGQGAA